MKRLLGLPIIWLGALSAILLALDAFSVMPISFGWATAPLWVPMVAVCGIAGCIVGIVACIVFAVVGICVGVIGFAAAIVTFVCALIMTLVVTITILAVAGAICAGALVTMYVLCGGNVGNAAAEIKKGINDDKKAATPAEPEYSYDEGAPVVEDAPVEDAPVVEDTPVVEDSETDEQL